MVEVICNVTSAVVCYLPWQMGICVQIVVPRPSAFTAPSHCIRKTECFVTENIASFCAGVGARQEHAAASCKHLLGMTRRLHPRTFRFVRTHSPLVPRSKPFGRHLGVSHSKCFPIALKQQPCTFSATLCNRHDHCGTARTMPVPTGGRVAQTRSPCMYRKQQAICLTLQNLKFAIA